MGNLIKELGYVGMEVSDLPAWLSFGENVLGLGAAEGPNEKIAKLRMDDLDYRILLFEGPADDLAFAGWRVADETALRAYAQKLDGLRIEYSKASAQDCELRGIEAALVITDPQGLRHEIYAGPVKPGAAFKSKMVESGFVTGAGGIGHIVFGSSNYAESLAFAHDVLEAEMSDTIIQKFTPEITANISFMHVNERHHSIAYANRAGGKRLHHLMLEVGAVEDVGRARDRHLMTGLLVAQDIGQHPNDRMISYYGVSPSGFLIEYGWGGRKVDEANWEEGHFTRMSDWGHRPYGAMPNGAQTLAPASAKPASNPKETVMSVDGNWVLTLNTPMGPQPAKLVIASADDVLTGTMESPGGEIPLLDGKQDGAVISWKADLTSPFPMTLTFVLTVDGDALAGAADGMMGKIPVTGARA